MLAFVAPLIPFRVVATLAILHAYSAGMQFHALEAQRSGPLSKSLPVRIRRWWATVPVAPVLWLEPGALQKKSNAAPTPSASPGTAKPAALVPATPSSASPGAAQGGSAHGRVGAGSSRVAGTQVGTGADSPAGRKQAIGGPPPRSASTVAREANEKRKSDEAQ